MAGFGVLRAPVLTGGARPQQSARSAHRRDHRHTGRSDQVAALPLHEGASRSRAMELRLVRRAAVLATSRVPAVGHGRVRRHDSGRRRLVPSRQPGAHRPRCARARRDRHPRRVASVSCAATAHEQPRRRRPDGHDPGDVPRQAARRDDLDHLARRSGPFRPAGPTTASRAPRRCRSSPATAP